MDYHDEVIAENLDLKLRCRVGPSAEVSLSFLSRAIRHVPEVGFECAPNLKHVDDVLSLVGLEGCTPASTPEVKDGGPALADEQDELDAGEAATYGATA